MNMMLANVLDHISDTPWPGGQVEVLGIRMTIMSSSIASMIVVGVLLAIFVPRLARRGGDIPHGGKNVLEILVIFVRDMIARPALHDKAYDFLPMLLTLFTFVLGMNLVGIFPTEPLTRMVGHYVPFMHGRLIGATPTSVFSVCAGLASLSFLVILFSAFKRAAEHVHHERHWPRWLCLAVSPALWVRKMAPPITGVAGIILVVPLTAMEIAGVVVKCGALLIRLLANMVAGHALLAVIMTLLLQAAAFALKENIAALGVSAVCILASVLLDVLEVMVAGLQAYIFTYLTAIFLGLYVEPGH